MNAILKQIPIEQIIRGQYQPRRQFDPNELQELADSIKTTKGLLQPIIVRPLGTQYEIVAGERRWRAAQLAGLSEVSCLIRHYTAEQALQAALIENINRTNLNPIEEAEGYQRLLYEFDYLHEEIAAVVGKSRASITNALRLLKLDSAVRAFVINKQLSEGHAKMLAALSPSEQLQLAQLCIQKKWSVRKIEQEVKKLQHPHPTNPFTDVNLKYLEKELSDHMGNPVSIHYESRGGGSLHIHFNNIDELEGHFARLGFEKLK